MSRNDVIGCVKRRALELLPALAVGVVMFVGFYTLAALGNAAGLNDGGFRLLFGGARRHAEDVAEGRLDFGGV